MGIIYMRYSLVNFTLDEAYGCISTHMKIIDTLEVYIPTLGLGLQVTYRVL